MSESGSISQRVLDTLVSTGLVTAEQAANAVQTASSDGVTVGHVLADRGLVASSDLGQALEDELGVPRVDLSSYAPDDSALALVPADVARARRVLPLFEIEGMLTVAIGDPLDVFVLDDVARDIGVEVEPVLAESSAVLGAIAQHYGEQAGAPAAASVALAGSPAAPAAAAPAEAPAPAAASGLEVHETIEEVAAQQAPVGPASIDLDVLAVADPRKTAILVADILEHAAERRASGVHLLPYKDDFFLVYRVEGRLEKIASAPLSMQQPLVDAFRTFAKLGQGSASAPGLGRVRTHLGDREYVVTVSAVPTVAGQRVVISLQAGERAPSGLAELGMNEAEVRVLHAMVERGRGILLVCAPVAGGRSATYYALLAHAASSGKTVYSVERSVEYEIPAVAQVMVNLGSPVAAASYLAAGLRQDTDVIAVDGLASVEDVHLAVEAAGLGKLVVATFAAGDVAAGVRRLLDLGAEPHSLAAALTLGIGQRLVRMNCPKCSTEGRSDLSARLPGGSADMPVKSGAGCPSCLKTGFQGATGIFEVLPFTEPVRAQVALGASLPAIDAAARAAGMRSLAVSGLARVKEGLVSPEELDRVLRLAERGEV